MPETAHLVVSIVCAAAESMAAFPQSVRAALHAAFARAKAMHQSVEEIEQALAPTKPAG